MSTQFVTLDNHYINRLDIVYAKWVMSERQDSDTPLYNIIVKLRGIKSTIFVIKITEAVKIEFFNQL